MRSPAAALAFLLIASSALAQRPDCECEKIKLANDPKVGKVTSTPTAQSGVEIVIEVTLPAATITTRGDAGTVSVTRTIAATPISEISSKSWWNGTAWIADGTTLGDPVVIRCGARDAKAKQLETKLKLEATQGYSVNGKTYTIVAGFQSDAASCNKRYVYTVSFDDKGKPRVRLTDITVDVFLERPATGKSCVYDVETFTLPCREVAAQICLPSCIETVKPGVEKGKEIESVTATACRNYTNCSGNVGGTQNCVVVIKLNGDCHDKCPKGVGRLPIAVAVCE